MVKARTNLTKRIDGLLLNYYDKAPGPWAFRTGYEKVLQIHKKRYSREYQRTNERSASRRRRQLESAQRKSKGIRTSSVGGI